MATAKAPSFDYFAQCITTTTTTNTTITTATPTTIITIAITPATITLTDKFTTTTSITISCCEGYFRTNYHAFDAKNRCDCVHRVSIEHALLVREDGVDFEQKNCS